MFNHLLSKDFQTVVDVGANRGQFALVARKHLPNAKIVSFEPLKEPAAIFRRVFSKDSLVILYEMAIGPAEREMAIHVSHADDSSSLLSITAMQNSLFPGTAEKETRPVQVKPLGTVLSSQLIKSPALLKIDVQGFELEVLKGSEDILGKFTHAYIECSFIELYEGQALAHEIIAWLEIRKFYFTGVYNVSYDRNGKAVQGDFLFTRIDENG
jgi:FkbM family methyltransferase